jgi:hypothetical protein
MPRPKQPVDLLIANGRKHLTKAEIAERRAQEAPPPEGEMEIPKSLSTKREKELFLNCVLWLEECNLDSPAYVAACEKWAQAQYLAEKRYKELKRLEAKPYEQRVYKELAELDSMYDKACKRAMSIEAKLGMTPLDRCKLIKPTVTVQEEKKNKFEALMDAPWQA